MSREGCEPKAADSTAKEAPDESTVPLSGRAASSTVRSKRPRDMDDEMALQEVCQALGWPEFFEKADAQEIRDLADSRNRKRGEKARKKRLDRGWVAVERARAVSQTPSRTELTAAVDRVAEGESLDGCTAGRSNWLD